MPKFTPQEIHISKAKEILAQDLVDSIEARDEFQVMSDIRNVIRTLKLQKMNFDDLSDYLVGLLVKYGGYDPDDSDIEFIDNNLRAIRLSRR